jgi:uncharacterized protein YukE
MTVSHGMNVEEVRGLGHQLQTQSSHIQELVGQLDSAINAATWMGSDADQFKGQWWPEHRQHLLQAAEGLNGFGQSALNNAQAQEDASRV